MKNFLKLMIASMILSSAGFARTGETGTGIGGGDPAHLIQSEEPKKIFLTKKCESALL